MSSEWVKHEGSLAYGWGKQLFPILIDPVDALPPWLEEYQWIDFVNTSREIAFEALVAALTPPNPIQDLLDQQAAAPIDAACFDGVDDPPVIIPDSPVIGQVTVKMQAKGLVGFPKSMQDAMNKGII